MRVDSLGWDDEFFGVDEAVDSFGVDDADSLGVEPLWTLQEDECLSNLWLAGFTAFS